jgi:hypothetical protein
MRRGEEGKGRRWEEPFAIGTVSKGVRAEWCSSALLKFVRESLEE